MGVPEKKKNPHENRRKRVREKFSQTQMAYFHDHEKLEMLLFYAIPRGDTNETGHALIERFGSISGVFDADYKSLLEVGGIGSAAATLIGVVGSLIQAYHDDYTQFRYNTLRSTAEAKDFMRHKFLCVTAEQVVMACIGGNGKVVFSDVVAHGSPEKVDINTIDILRKAIATQAVRVVLGHNHPSGICNPSNKDVFATKILADELSRVGVELLDHIIVAPDGVCSMRESGLIV
jgi:DNA repair protein RadC